MQVVGGRGQHQAAVLENVGDDVGVMGLGGVVHADVLHALFRQQAGQPVGHRLGVAVHGGIRHHHARFLRLVGRPQRVFFHQQGNGRPPQHRPVQRANHFGRLALQLLHGHQHLGAKLAHNVGVVAARLVQVQVLVVHLVAEQIAPVAAKGAEGVGGEKDALGALPGKHHLGPVHHGRHDELQVVPPQGQGVPLLHLHGAALQVHAEELPDELEGFGVAHDLYVRPAAAKLLDVGGVVRLHVGDHQVIQRAAVQSGLQVLKKLAAHGGVHCVQQGGLFIHNQVGVVCDTVGQREQVLKKVQAAVAAAHPVNVVRHSLHIAHRNPSFSQSSCNRIYYNNTNLRMQWQTGRYQL